MKALALLTAGMMMILACRPVRAGLIEDSEIQVGFEIFHHHYRESHFMQLYGPQVGLYGSFTYLAFHPLRLELQVAGAGGDITYDGAQVYFIPDYGFISIPVKDDVGNSIFHFRPLVGWTFENISIGDLVGIKIIPFSGLAYRYLINRLDELAGGYKREQSYYYLPLGVEASIPWPYDKRFRLGARTELDILLHGKHTTGPPDPQTFTQSSGWGFQFAPGARYDLTKELAVTAELYFRYWKIATSTESGGYVEPRNATSEYGVKLGVAF